MGSYRSPYSMLPDTNRNSSPNFQWFHPSFFSSSRTGFNPFQGAHHLNSNTDAGGGHGAISAIPVRSLIPPPEAAAHNDEDDVGAAALIQPTTKAKKPKTSKKPPTDRMSPKPMKPKQASKDPSTKPKKTKSASSSSTAKRERKDLNLAIYEGNVDLTGIPAPFCSCTGVARQCYRWGAGGWQSSCCTTNVSEYPLPMSATRPGSRMAGRKMSHGAYEKLIQRLSAEGYDLSHPIDLKQHWARHGTNKFVTIK